jgi:RNA polymerase sigma-70 factor (ECF subfamily)
VAASLNPALEDARFCPRCGAQARVDFPRWIHAAARLTPARETARGRASLRAWLYRIATNACLDAFERRPRAIAGGAPEVRRLQPFPDALLDQLADGDRGPDAADVDRETIELAFLIAIQHLPPRQRAVLLARDVLSFSAAETAELLDLTVAQSTAH